MSHTGMSSSFAQFQPKVRLDLGRSEPLIRAPVAIASRFVGALDQQLSFDGFVRSPESRVVIVRGGVEKFLSSSTTMERIMHFKEVLVRDFGVMRDECFGEVQAGGSVFLEPCFKQLRQRSLPVL